MEYLQPIFIVAVGCGIAVGIALYIYHRHVASKTPSAAPATVSHVGAILNEVKAVGAKIETSNAVREIKQRVEDLHDKFDKQGK